MHRLLGKRDELYIPPQNPFEVFILGLGLLAALPLLRGDTGSAVLEANLDDTAVILWGAALLIGAAMALVGMWLPTRWALLGLYLERGGLILAGGAASIYAYIVFRESNPDDVRYIVSTQTGFAVACLWRSIQLTRGIHWSRTHTSKVGGERVG